MTGILAPEALPVINLTLMRAWAVAGAAARKVLAHGIHVAA